MGEKVEIRLLAEGDDQVVRIPDAFRLEGERVLVWKEGSRVILEPVAEKSGWPAGFWERLDAVGPLWDDFARPEPLPPSPHRDAILEEFGRLDG